MKNRGLVLVLAWLVVVSGLAISVFHYYAGEPGGPDGWLPSAAFGAPIVGVGALALLGLYRLRPELSVMSILALGPMCLVSVILFPLLFVAAVMLSIVLAGQKNLELTAVLISAGIGFSLVGVFFLSIFVEELHPGISIGTVAASILVGLVWSSVDQPANGLNRLA